MAVEKSDFPNRKQARLKGYDYSTPGVYFVTICLKDGKRLLSDITVGEDAHILPKNNLSEIGIICDKHINHINSIYENVTVDKYVIMPNHIHMIIFLYGSMKASTPTKNIQTIVRSFKTMVTKEIGYSIWQRSYYDHIIRGEADYLSIWNYIDTNVIRWKKDCFCKE